MQRHTESIGFGLFLNLNISGTPYLSDLIFWISINIQITTSSEQNHDETLFLVNLTGVEIFWKNIPAGKYDANFLI